MKFYFVPMNENYANEIAYNWKYEGIYSFYDMTSDEEDLKEFLSKETWGKNHFAVLNKESVLIGFYTYYFENDIMWIGFGLKPELTGKGLGKDFIKAGINFGIENFNYDKDCVMLAVAKFNKRAIKVYEKIGFRFVEKYIQKTNGGEFKFIKMQKILRK